jgi:hypothetical protein
VAFEGCASLPVLHERPLLKGEDYALVDVAAFELAVRVCGLLYGHGFVGAQAEPPIGQQGHCVIQGTGSAVVCGLRERDTEVPPDTHRPDQGQ